VGYSLRMYIISCLVRHQISFLLISVYQFKLEVRSVALSPDNMIVLAGKVGGAIEIYEASSGQLLEQLQGHLDYVTSLTFTPDGRRFLSSSRDKIIHYWEISFDALREGADKELNIGSKLLCRLVDHTGGINCVSVSHDGQWIASAGADHTVILWDNALASRLILNGHDDHIGEFKLPF
jgi:WD40 repeat protein